MQKKQQASRRTAFYSWRSAPSCDHLLLFGKQLLAKNESLADFPMVLGTRLRLLPLDWGWEEFLCPRPQKICVAQGCGLNHRRGWNQRAGRHSELSWGGAGTASLWAASDGRCSPVVLVLACWPGICLCVRGSCTGCRARRARRPVAVLSVWLQASRARRLEREALSAEVGVRVPASRLLARPPALFFPLAAGRTDIQGHFIKPRPQWGEK